jgi:hypothetical protein
MKSITIGAFPRIVFDDFLDPELLDLVLAEFPEPGAIRWANFR